MQLLGKGDEIAQLPKLHLGHPRSVLPRSHAARGRSLPGAARRRTPSRGRATVSLIIRADERSTCWSFRPTRAGSSLDTTTRARSQTERTIKCHPSGPATIAPQVCARARTQPSVSTSSRPPPRVYGVGNAGNDGSRCGCACPAAGSHARTAPRTSTPEPTTRRPTTPSPSVIRAAHTRAGVMSTNARSEPDLCTALHPSASFNRRRDASISASAADAPRPGGSFDALARLELLVDLEEMLDLEPVELGQVVQVAQVLQPGVMRGNTDQLVVAARFVAHAEHADRAAQHEHPGEQRLPDRDEQRIERIAVLAQGVLDVAVVTGVLRRGEQGAVQPDPAAGVVDLVLVAAAPRNLDEHVEHRRTQTLPLQHLRCVALPMAWVRGLERVLTVRPQTGSDQVRRLSVARRRAAVAASGPAVRMTLRARATPRRGGPLDRCTTTSRRRVRAAAEAAVASQNGLRRGQAVPRDPAPPGKGRATTSPLLLPFTQAVAVCAASLWLTSSRRCGDADEECLRSLVAAR